MVKQYFRKLFKTILFQYHMIVETQLATPRQTHHPPHVRWILKDLSLTSWIQSRYFLTDLATQGQSSSHLLLF